MKYRIIFILSALVFLLASVSSSEAASLTFVSDTISTSVPSANADHIIRFTAASIIPVSGKIVITPEAGASGSIEIPSGLDYSDIDFLVGGTNKALNSSPGTGAGGVIGVSVVTGTSGSITFTLNDTDTISSSTAVIVKIGTNATVGAPGDKQIKNPSAADSYRIKIETKDSLGNVVDTNDAMIAVVLPVSMTTAADNQSPVANAGPDQTLTDTDNSGSESATLDGSGSTDADGTISSFVWREDNIQIATGASPTISLAVGTHAITLTVTDNDDATDSDGVTIIVNPPAGSSGLGGGAPAPPSPMVGPATVVSTSGTGTICSSEKGLISISNIDGSSASVSLDAGSLTQCTEITTSPLAKGAVVSVAPLPAGLDIAGDLVYSFNARTAADTPVEQFLKPVTLRFAYTDAQIADLDEETLRIYFLNQSLGIWELVPDSKPDAANNTISGTVSHFTVFAVMGASLRPVPEVGDLNNDSRVDLVDFSILLFNWGVPKDSIADLNKDGKVDLVDFSILLYWWTG